jgi:hypothetical protein
LISFIIMKAVVNACLQEYNTAEQARLEAERRRLQLARDEVDTKQREASRLLEEVSLERQRFVRERENLERERAENLKRIEEVCVFLFCIRKSIIFFFLCMQADRSLAARESSLSRSSAAFAEEKVLLERDRALLDTVQQRLYQDASQQARTRDDVQEKVWGGGKERASLARLGIALLLDTFLLFRV